MLKAIREEHMSLLKVYTLILDTCTNKRAQAFLIGRVFKILSRTMKARASADFPQTSYDLQVVNLVAYLREGKLPYAFLYASSLHGIITQNTSKNSAEPIKGIQSWLDKITAYFGF